MPEARFLALEVRVREPELHFATPEALSVAKLPVFDACICAWPARATERTGHLGADRQLPVFDAGLSSKF
jgi:hypothetical protein